MITLEDAIVSLRPGAEWSLSGNNVEGIIWHTQGVEPLSFDEVSAEMQRLQQLADEKEQAEVAARQAAISHAKSLGFTDEMIAVMYPALISD